MSLFLFHVDRLSNVGLPQALAEIVTPAFRQSRQLDGATEKIVNAKCHIFVNPARVQLIGKASIENRGGQARRNGELRDSYRAEGQC